MNKYRQSNNLDGFVLRRRDTVPHPHEGHSYHTPQPKLPQPDPVHGETMIGRERTLLQNTKETNLHMARTTQHHAAPQPPVPTLQDDIGESLKAIDQEPKKRKERRGPGGKKIAKRLLMIVAIILIGISGYFGYKLIFASNAVFKGNLFDVFTAKTLQRDANGRTNILVFGTSEDDPSHVEEGSGAELTDSIMVVSVDQVKKNAVMFSIPRDLWVNYGLRCFAGFEGKINAVYECAKSGSSEQSGANKLKEVVGESFGIDIQYYAKVNYSALKDAVNAVGGITVTIDSDNKAGIYDPNFDWMCNYRCKMVKYPNGPVELDGEHALALARARNANGGYGLGGGNFDREQYQQKIMIAIKEKAASAGTLTNPVKVSALIDSLGNNIRTNFETGEVKTLVDLTAQIKKENIRSINLVDENKPLVTTGMYSGQSIVQPVAGINNFSQIRAFIKGQLGGANAEETNEDATIEVLNGTDRSGVASRKQTELATKGIVVTSIGDAPTSSSYGALQWFDMTGGAKPKTAQKLKSVLGEESSGATLPSGVRSDADFVIVIGN